MNDLFDKYSKKIAVAKTSLACCECMKEIPRGEEYELLTCKFKDGGESHQVKFCTCLVCKAVRQEHCVKVFTPSGLLNDLETLRTALPYDSIREWSVLTNAISNIRIARARARQHPSITLQALGAGRVVAVF